MNNVNLFKKSNKILLNINNLLKSIPIEDREYFQPDKGEFAPQGVAVYRGERRGSYYVPDYSYSKIKQSENYLNSLFNSFPRLSEYVWLLEHGKLSYKEKQVAASNISNMLKNTNEDFTSFFKKYAKFHNDIFDMFQKHTGVSFNLEGLDSETSMKLVDSHVKIYNLFPSIYKKSIDSVSAAPTPDGYNDSAIVTTHIVPEESINQKSKIEYHQKFALKDSLNSFYQQEQTPMAKGETGYIQSTDDIDIYTYSTIHEFGHCIQFYLALNDIKEKFGYKYKVSDFNVEIYLKKGELNHSLGLIYDEYLKEVKRNPAHEDKFAKKYSRYASSTNFQEFYAELIAASICGSDKYNNDPMINQIRLQLADLERNLASKT